MLTRTLFLDDQPDPELAISSKNQWHNLPDMRFTVTFFDFSTDIPCQDPA